jgi:hypothetical protein
VRPASSRAPLTHRPRRDTRTHAHTAWQRYTRPPPPSIPHPPQARSKNGYAVPHFAPLSLHTQTCGKARGCVQMCALARTHMPWERVNMRACCACTCAGACTGDLGGEWGRGGGATWEGKPMATRRGVMYDRSSENPSSSNLPAARGARVKKETRERRGQPERL